MDTTEKLLAAFNAVHPLTNEAGQLLAGHFEFFNFPAKETIVKPGETKDFYFFVLSGILRVYYVYPDKEVTSNFMRQGFMFLPCKEAKRNYIHVPEGVQTLTKCHIAIIHAVNAQMLMAKHPAIAHFFDYFKDVLYLQSVERDVMLRNSSLPERLACFECIFPGLLNQVNNQYVASCLNISLSTFANLKKPAIASGL
jgi:CRP/FNR family transcriptional regulator, anaerobic regulatory protein